MGRALTIVKHGALVERSDGEVVSLRQSSVVALAAHGLLDVRQVEAAFRFRNMWEQLAQDMPRHIDPFTWHERSSGKMAEPENVAEARKLVRRCKTLLGIRGFDLVARVCGDGYHLRDLFSTRRERDTNTDMLRAHLTDLAVIFDSAR